MGTNTAERNGNFMKEISEYRGYKVPVWDIIELVDSLPIMRGSSAYHVSYRETINAFFAEQMAAVSTNDEAYIFRGELLRDLKTRSREATHSLSCSGSLPNQERFLARQDAYATLYDSIREEL